MSASTKNTKPEETMKKGWMDVWMNGAILRHFQQYFGPTGAMGG